jgi:hypothetical protein
MEAYQFPATAGSSPGTPALRRTISSASLQRTPLQHQASALGGADAPQQLVQDVRGLLATKDAELRELRQQLAQATGDLRRNLNVRCVRALQ